MIDRKIILSLPRTIPSMLNVRNAAQISGLKSQSIMQEGPFLFCQIEGIMASI